MFTFRKNNDNSHPVLRINNLINLSPSKILT